MKYSQLRILTDALMRFSPNETNSSCKTKGLAALALTYALLTTASAGVANAAEVSHVQSVADAREGATLTMSRYDVPGDGLLVVRIGAKGPLSKSVTFNGQEMVRVAALGASYFTSISAEMYYLPVAASDSGSIEVDYGFSGTDGKAIIAATLLGVDTFDHMKTYTDGETFSEGRTGPNLAEFPNPASQDSVILSVFTDHGRGIPAETGVGHVLDAHPTTPESVFHETKVLAGHVMTPLPGTYSLGFRNTDPLGHMDYVMIVAAFSSSSSPSPTPVPSGGLTSYLLMSLGLLALGTQRRKRS